MYALELCSFSMGEGGTRGILGVFSFEGSSSLNASLLSGTTSLFKMRTSQ